MKQIVVTSLAIGLGFLFMVSISHAATLDIRDGQLFGAAGVDVDGVLYDVAFLDGTCAELYGGADDNMDFPFTNPLNFNDDRLVRIASQALLDQVFVDSPLGAFDSVPNLTNGCSSSRACNVWTPMRVFGSNVSVKGTYNRNSEDGDYIFTRSLVDRTSDTWPPDNSPNRDDRVWAVWSEASAVPIPAAAWLLGSGLVGLIGARRELRK